MALGITLYFALSFEPSILFVGLTVLLLGFLGFLFFKLWSKLFLAVVICALGSGFVLSKLRTELVRAPVVSKDQRYYQVTGELERLVLITGKKKQLYLKNLSLSKLAPSNTPDRIRIISRIVDEPLIVGSKVKLGAFLQAPPGPVRPGGFDFARQSWFQKIGAVGFAVSKVEIVHAGSPFSFSGQGERWRQIVSDKIRAVTSGDGRDIALALIVGEKRSINPQVLSSIRAAGLAHMLAISGMHMALVSGTVYWLIRALLAAWQTLALLVDVRKIAAICAILVAGAYFVLSGMGISTLRAFIMISIMFLAILSGRRAISLRNVSVAALIILTIMPESLMEVGFQMSFASVVALVSFYERGRTSQIRAQNPLFIGRAIEKFRRGAGAIFMTTLIAGLAVTPIAIYHFHHVTTYSVIGNMLAMPILTLVVMPMALVSLMAMPFDLHAVPLFLMQHGNTAIIEVAKSVAGLENARVNVGTMGLPALSLILSGGLWLGIWRSNYRFAGVILIVAGITLSPFLDIPFLLVEREGKNIVLIDPVKREMWPMVPRKAKYSLEKWRSSFGLQMITRPKQKKAVQYNKKWRCDQYGCTALYKDLIIAYSSHPGALGEDCAKADILIATYPVPRKFISCKRVTKIIDVKSLKRNGAHAFYLHDQKIKTVHSRETRGRRPWSTVVKRLPRNIL